MMNKKKLLTMLGCFALVGIITVGLTLAYMTDNDSASNVITMGHVDITLTEPNYRPDNPSENGKGGEITNIKPGAEIEKDPTITVADASSDTYIRVKLTVSGEKLDEEHIAALVQNLDINDTEWQKVGDYYYYVGQQEGQEVGVLSKGQKVKLFEKVIIPSTWGNEVANSSIDIDVEAEAIQADNFKPTMDAEGKILGWYNEDGSDVTVETYTN